MVLNREHERARARTVADQLLSAATNLVEASTLESMALTIKEPAKKTSVTFFLSKLALAQQSFHAVTHYAATHEIIDSMFDLKNPPLGEADLETMHCFTQTLLASTELHQSLPADAQSYRAPSRLDV